MEYGFQKIGKNFSYPVSEKFTTSETNDEAIEEEIDVTFHGYACIKISDSVNLLSQSITLSLYLCKHI